MNLPLLQHHRRLFLRGLQVQARIGIHDFELQAPQRMRFDVDLYVPYAHSSPTQDRIDEIDRQDEEDIAEGKEITKFLIRIQPKVVCIPDITNQGTDLLLITSMLIRCPGPHLVSGS
jgi:hypothetical protein